MIKLKRTIAIVNMVCLLAVSASAQNGDSTRFRSAAEYSGRNLGVGLLVMERDEIVFEDYTGGVGVSTPWPIASGTKSFSGVMLAAAVEDGLISGFDEKVSDTIAEWKSDPLKRNITLRELLNLTSGIDGGGAVNVQTYREAINSPVSSNSGKEFRYGPNPFQIFGEVMTRKLKASGETVRDYLERRIFKPIGMKVSIWRRVQNDPILANGMALTARDWSKFGLLLRDKGRFGGKQVVPEKLISELLKGSETNPAYGITFWLNREGIRANGGIFEMFETGADESLGKDIFMAAGLGNQRLYIIPSKNLVIVRFGMFGRFSDAEFLNLLLKAGRGNDQSP